MIEPLFTAKKCNTTLEYLLHRRSCPIKHLTEPGPSHDEIEKMLHAASRVPDHGKLFPWYFIVIDDSNKTLLGELLKKAWIKEDPNASAAKLKLESERFHRAPLVIAVISKIRHGKAPAWEQILSAGAVSQNLIIAANSLGYGANWVTEWYTYSETFNDGFGIDKNENIAGFIYIGSKAESPLERERPSLSDIVTYWAPEIALNKGHNYERKTLGLPRKGFTLNLKD